MQRILKWLRNIALILASLFFLAIILELSTRFFSDLPPRLLQRNAQIGGAYIPNIQVTLKGPESGQQIAIRTNNEGFRGAEVSRQKPANTLRIAVLGDSQMAAINTPEKHIFSSLLEKKLAAEHPDNNWQVLNFSVSGASTGQELNLYRKVVRQYQPDLVICVYYNGNDFSDNSLVMSRNPRIYLTLDANGNLVTQSLDGAGGLLAWIKRHSRFYQWQKLTVRAARKNAIKSGWLGSKNRIRGGLLAYINPQNNPTLSAVWQLNDALLGTFNTEVKNDGAQFLLVSIPHSLEFDRDVLERINISMSQAGYADSFSPAQVESRLRSTSRSHDISAIFLNDKFAQSLAHGKIADRNFHLTYLNGNGHINEAAHRLISDVVGDAIKVDETGNSGLSILN